MAWTLDHWNLSREDKRNHSLGIEIKTCSLKDFRWDEFQVRNLKEIAHLEILEIAKVEQHLKNDERSAWDVDRLGKITKCGQSYLNIQKYTRDESILSEVVYEIWDWT